MLGAHVLICLHGEGWLKVDDLRSVVVVIVVERGHPALAFAGLNL